MAHSRPYAVQANGRRIVAGVFAVAAFAALWLYLGPSQVGGAATYSITEGISMQPLLRNDDLALVRAQSTYKVGDVVLYQSSTLHRPVLHRIIVIQDGHYFFKGDNNSFVDPGYATRSELIGTLWFHVGKVGGVLSWLGKPLHAALLAGLTTFLLLLGGVTAGRRKCRRRGPLAAGLPARTHRSRYALPRARATLVSLILLVLFGVVSLGVGFATPATHMVDLPGAFSHSGTFRYSAGVLRASPVYPSGFAITGQPLFTNLVNGTNVEFRYRFSSRFEHQVHGTIELKALIFSDASGWRNLYVVKRTDSFSGDTAATGGLMQLRSLYTLLNQLSEASGTAGAEYSVDLQPVVHVVGIVGGRPIDSTFSPVLPFTVTAGEVKLAVAPAVSPPGATYTPPTGHSALEAALMPSQLETAPQRTANLVTVARYEIPVLVIRLLGVLALAAAVLVAALNNWWLHRQQQRPEEELIAARFSVLVAPVETLVLPAGLAPTPVQDFTSLARLAQYLERPILRRTDKTGSTYAVDDETRVYQYYAATSTHALLHEKSPQRGVRNPRWRLGRPSRFTVAGSALAVLIAITLVTSLTATTNVPTSKAGASNQPRQISQLAPTGCSSLTLTSIVFGSGNFKNTASNALVLGDAGANTITDQGTSNCIVGGGGGDVVNGDPTDTCIIGPGSGTNYKKCKTA